MLNLQEAYLMRSLSLSSLRKNLQKVPYSKIFPKMDPPSSSQTATAAAADEWELCNDDGFIYKREKRRRILTEPAPLSAADPEEEEKRRREWKRKNLLRVKEKYKKEIEEWEILSETLKAMQEKALGFQAQQQERRRLWETEEKQRTAPPSGSEKKDKDKTSNASGSLVDELLLQVEAQEMIIRDVSNLCDIAEAMCNVQEERWKQTYFDLPIWASPRDLMASLCDDEARNCAVRNFSWISLIKIPTTAGNFLFESLLESIIKGNNLGLEQSFDMSRLLSAVLSHLDYKFGTEQTSCLISWIDSLKLFLKYKK